jgi:hypothetical protein
VLLGLLVEATSGEDCPAYVRRHSFDVAELDGSPYVASAVGRATPGSAIRREAHMKTGILKLTAILAVLVVAGAGSSTRTQLSAGETMEDPGRYTGW